jgi:hypothetical protein
MYWTHLGKEVELSVFEGMLSLERRVLNLESASPNGRNEERP